MRSRPLRLLTLVSALLAAQAPHARAADPDAKDPTLEIEVATTLAPGPGQLEVVLALGDGAAQPLLLTVTSEGAAIQVVRGRFLGADGRDEHTQHGARLRFVVPIIVRAQGSAIVRAELLTYRCMDGCRALRATSRRTLEVGQPEPVPAPGQAPGPAPAPT